MIGKYWPLHSLRYTNWIEISLHQDILNESKSRDVSCRKLIYENLSPILEKSGIYLDSYLSPSTGLKVEPGTPCNDRGEAVSIYSILFGKDGFSNQRLYLHTKNK